MKEQKQATKVKPGVKLLICISIVIVILFIGFSLYYFMKNNEEYIYSIDNGGSVHMNIGETCEFPIKIKKKNSHTNITVKITSESGTEDNSILQYDSTKNILVASNAEAGGTVSVVVTSTNSKFNTFSFTVWVGDGSNENPWFIKNASDFSKIADGSSKYQNSDVYLLENSIDFEGKQISPIPNFDGFFIGNQNTISNFSIQSNQGNVGLFANLSENARVEQLTVQNAKITSDADNVGIIAGENLGLIKRCVVKNSKLTATNSSANAGLICGNLARGTDGDRSYVMLCSVSSSDVVSSGNAGGIAGNVNSGNIVDCYSCATISGQLESGGIAGVIKNESNMFAIIKNCYSTPTFKEDAVNKYAICSFISNEYVSGEDGVKLIENYFMSSEDYCPHSSFGESNIKIESADQTKHKINFSNLNTESTWLTDNDKKSIYLDVVNGSENAVKIYEYTSTISSANDLKTVLERMRNIENDEDRRKTYKISSSITLDYAGERITPIGTIENPFKGSFTVSDGATVTIKNFKLDASGTSYVGFFGVTAGADCYINNFVIDGCEIINSSSTGYVADFIGYAYDGIFENCKVKNSNLNALSGGFVAGLVALNNATIKDCSATLNMQCSGLQADLILGFLCAKNNGKIENSIVSNCFVEISSTCAITCGGICGINFGDITNSLNNLANISLTSSSSIYAGSVCGSNQQNLTKCFSNSSLLTVSVKEKAYVGGISGYANSISKMLNCASVEDTITADDIGGLVGYAHGLIKECYTSSTLNGKNVASLIYCGSADIKNCYTICSIKASETINGIVKDFCDGLSISNCYIASSITEFTGDTKESINVGSCDEKFQKYRAPFFSKKTGVLNYDNVVVNEGFFKYSGANVWNSWDFLDFLQFDSSKKNYSISSTIFSQSEIDTFNSLKYDTTVWAFEIGGEKPILRNTDFELGDYQLLQTARSEME